MRWTKAMLCQFGIMREAGYSVPEIAAELGITKQQVYDKKSYLKKERKRTMSKYPEKKRARIDPYEFWSIYDSLRDAKAVASHFGCSVQTVYNHITKGRPKTPDPAALSIDNSEAQNEDNVNSDNSADDIMNEVNDAGADSVSVPDENENNEGDINMEEMGISGLYKNTKGARAAEGIQSDEYNGESHALGIIDLAIRANSLARTFGFVPEHMSVDTDDIRQEIIVSGTDSAGKVYEVQFSVTDTAKLMP